MDCSSKVLLERVEKELEEGTPMHQSNIIHWITRDGIEELCFPESNFVFPEQLCVRLAGIHKAIGIKRKRLTLRRLYGFVLSLGGYVTVAPSPRHRAVFGSFSAVARANNHFWSGATFMQLRPPLSQRLAKIQSIAEWQSCGRYWSDSPGLWVIVICTQI